MGRGEPLQVLYSLSPRGKGGIRSQPTQPLGDHLYLFNVIVSPDLGLTSLDSRFDVLFLHDHMASAHKDDRFDQHRNRFLIQHLYQAIIIIVNFYPY